MKIYKFGGASVKDAKAIKNIKNILQQDTSKNVVVVISAMDKTTNAMELVVKNYFEDKEKLGASIDKIVDFHHQIMLDLFLEGASVFKKVAKLFEEMKGFLVWNKSLKYSFIYDQVVGYGELLSTTIISEYLNTQAILGTWLDVRNFIKTDRNYRDAKVDWELTKQFVSKEIKRGIYITQGFLGSDENNFTTTLGREGSDYTAAIFAYCLNAESVTIWKDVPGVMNADPKHFEKTQLLHQISYREAIELSFYGASVIHPKTLQPLQRKEIPLYVKSFLQPEQTGTQITKDTKILPKVPCFIVKKEQIFLKLSTLDFSFIVEDNIREIFQLFHQYKIKVRLIQNSAISISFCLEDRFKEFKNLLKNLENQFKIEYHQKVVLYTVRHFDTTAIEYLKNNKQVLLEQRTQEILQFITKQ